MKKLLIAVVGLWPIIVWANFASFQINGPSTSTCQTLGTLTCDANGWTQFNVGPGGFVEGHTACTGAAANATCIIYVSTSGSDANDGTFAAPLATGVKAVTYIRDGSPDWILFKCGDTWTENAIGSVNKGGLNASNPVLLSAYDGGAGHNPPVPNTSSCSASPKFLVSSTWVNDPNGPYVVFPAKNATAMVGLYMYAFKRDPANGSFSLTEAAVNTPGMGNGQATSDILYEDCTIAFFTQDLTWGGSGANSFYQHLQNLYLRRNRILSSYPSANFAVQGILASNIYNGPSGYVIYENIVDHNGWNTDNVGITWAAPSGRSHNIYSSQATVNADATTHGTPATIKGNILGNDGGATLFQVGGNIEDNFCVASPFCYITQTFTNFANTLKNNVATSPAQTAGVGGANSIEFVARSFEGWVPWNPSATFQATGNFIVNSTEDPAATGILLDPGSNGITASGNVVYNWGRTNTSQALVNTNGSLLTQHVSTQGSAYTDNSVAISAAASSNSAGFVDGQDYIVVTVANTTGIPTTSGTVMFKKTAGAIQGPFPAAVVDTTHVQIYGTNYTSFGGTTFAGTLYFPWYHVTLTNVSSHCSVFPTASILSVGGNILDVNFLGGDGPSEIKDIGGTGCQAGDTLSATPGSACLNNGICANGWSWNGSAATGSGLVVTLDTVTANTVATIDTTGPCTLPAHNVTDSAGTNFCSFTDPNRTAGSYYATLAGSTANATFTGSIDAAGVLHVTAMTSGTLNLGDAITFSGQTKADYIKGNSTTSNTLCVPGTGSANCTGTGSNAPATYALTGINTSVGSQAMSGYTAQQLVNAMRAQTKPTWKTTLTACAVNTYIKAGFGVTDTCNVNQ